MGAHDLDFIDGKRNSMAQDGDGRIAILYPGDYEGRRNATAENNRSQTCLERLPPRGYTPSLRFITTIFARKYVTNSCKLTVSSYGLILFKADGTGLFSIPCFARWQPQEFLSAHIPTSY